MSKEIQNQIIKDGGYAHPTSMIKENVQIDNPIHLSIRTEIHKNCIIGKYTFINGYTVIYTNTKIGNYCTFARNCEISVASHPNNWLSSNSFQYSNGLFPKLQKLNIQKKKYNSHKITEIGSDVWIGAKAIILNGVKIGHGSIIAAGAVVTQDIEPYSIVGGVPAKLIRKRFLNEQIELLLELKWWELDPEDLDGIDFSNIDKAIQELKNKKG